MGRRKKNAESDDFEIVEIDLDDNSPEDANAFFEDDAETGFEDGFEEEGYEEPEELENEDYEGSEEPEDEDYEGPEELEEEDYEESEEPEEEDYEESEETEDYEESEDYEYDHAGESDDLGIQEIDHEEDKETKVEEKVRRHKRRKVAAIVAASILGVIAAAYAGLAFYFGNHFFFGTTINGTEFSMKSVAQVEEYMRQQVADYSLTIEKSEGTSEQIDGSAIELEYVQGEELQKLVESQEKFFWIKAFWEKPEIEAEVGVKYNDELLAAAIGNLACLIPENQVASVDAYPEFQGTEFVIVPEVIGTQIDTEKLDAAVREKISGFQHELDLTEAGCYIQPRFFEGDEAVIAARDAMNAYLAAQITYDFNPNTELVDATVISQWVQVDADMNVTFNEEAVRAYVASLADTYDTVGKTREFTTANGNVVSVNPGTYGWKIDQETEYANLIANIQNAEVVTREPAYSSRAAVHDTMDMGSTYAEVDLSAQHMWYFQNGQVIMDSPVVTGNPNIGNRATPSGVYSILEMMRNKTLRGERDPETGEPEYETPVSFWMRVTWSGIGFHDATWQPSFGGTLYRTRGSHGCINMPYGQAQALYNSISVGTPVVIHY